MGCHPTRVLRDEHQLILKVVDAFEGFIDTPGRDDDRARDFVRFFALYTDTFHHAKEEDLLFDALVDEGFPLRQGPIAAMLEDHQRGRALVAQMDGALERIAATGAGANDFMRAARRYIDLLRSHIRREDGGVFDMADNALDEPTCRRLCDAYEEVCSRRFAGRTPEQLERLGLDLTLQHDEVDS